MIITTPIYYLLVFSLAYILPQWLTFIFFFVVMVIMPGYIVASAVFPGIRFYIKFLFSMVFGTAILFLLIFLAALFGVDLIHIAYLNPVFSIALILFLRRSLGTESSERQEAIPDYPLSRPVMIIMTLILLSVTVIIITVGDPLLYTGDSPDQIAYIKTVSRSGEAFPSQYLHKEGGGLTRDVRKGLVHSMWGLITLLTGRSDVVNIWPLISAIGSLFLLLAIFCVGVMYFRSGVIGLLSIILFILYYHGGLESRQLITVAYGFPFGKIYFYAFLAVLPLALRRVRKDILFLVAAGSFAATGTHITHIMLIAFVSFIFAIIEYLQSDPESRSRLLNRTAPILAGVVTAATLPYLLMRYIRDYNPANIIHTHKQGVFIIADGFEIVNPIVFLQSGGVLVVIALFSIFILWKKSREEKNLRLLLYTAAAVYIISFIPIWVSFLMDRISYLLFRFETAAATMVISAYLLKTVWDTLIRKIPKISRGRAVSGVLIVIIALIPPLFSLPGNFAYAGPSLRESRENSCFNLEDLYNTIDDLIPPGSVIASDPVTSYCIPAFCDQFVVCTYDQHSIPNDSTALDRIMACRDIYLPGTTCSQVSETLEKYGTEYVIINSRLPSSIITKYWRPGYSAAVAASEKLANCGRSCDLIYNKNGISIYRFKAGASYAPESNSTAAGYQTADSAAAVSEYESGLIDSGTEGIYIEEIRLQREVVERGDTLKLGISWWADREIPLSSYTIYIRFDTDFPRGKLYGEWYGKIYRKIVEKFRGVRYRFRRTRLPFGGVYPPDRWPVGEKVYENFYLNIPQDISPGKYIISVKMTEATQYPNYTVKDIFTDNDMYDGSDIAEIVIK